MSTPGQDSGTGRALESVVWGRWTTPGYPCVLVRRTVADGIQSEVLRGFNAVPKRGAEMGGLLLGRRTAGQIIIEDFEPVPCEHRFGPSYQLSTSDFDTLRETLEWFRSDNQRGVSVLGFYRSHTRAEFSLASEDLQLCSEYFADPAQVFLLIKPNRLQESVADFFFWREGELVAGLHVVRFPFEDSEPEPDQTPVLEAAPPEPSVPVPPPVRTVPEPAPPSVPPIRRPRRYDEELPKTRHLWTWGAAAVVLAIIGAAISYQSMQNSQQAAPPRIVRAPATPEVIPPTAGEPIQPPPATTEPQPQAQQPTAVKPEPVKPKPEPARTAPETPAARDRAIRSVLDRWAAAIRNGEETTALHLYAQRVAPYLNKREARPSDVLGQLRYLHGRNGKLAINRISNLHIAPQGRDVAKVTFRRHWETYGRRKSVGEVQERLTLVRFTSGWKIASEQETRIY